MNPGTGSPAGRRTGWVGPALKLFVSGLILWRIVAMIRAQEGIGSLRDALASLHWGWILLGLGVHLVGTATNVVRYRVLLEGQGIRASWRFLFGSLLVGRFFGAVSPGGFTGFGGWRIYEVGRYTQKYARAAAAIGVETIVGQLAFGSVLMLGSMFGARVIGTSGVLLVNAAFGAVLLAGLAFLARPGLFGALADRLPARARVRVRTFVEALQAYRGKGRILLVALGCAVVVHTTHFLIYVCTAQALSADQVGAGEVFFGSSLQILATMLPASINGIGLREMTAVALYTSPDVGVPLATAVLIPSLGFAIEMLVSMAGAPIFLARRSGYDPHIVVEDPDRESAALAEIPIAPESEWPTVRRGLELGLCAGLLAGIVVGIAEGAVVVHDGHGRTGPWVIAYGAIAYTAFCAAVGATLGACDAWLARAMRRAAGPEPAWLGGLLALLVGGIGFGVTAFRVRRDVFHEELAWRSTGGLGLLVACALGALLLAFTLFHVARAIASRSPWLLQPSRLLGVAAAVLAVVAGASLAVGEPPRADAVRHGDPPPDAHHVIVIVVDTLRADHLPSYGYEQIETPNLDAFAADAIRFDQAFANASWTRPSFASLLTGRYASSHGVMAKSAALGDDVTTLAEALAAGGYATHGIVTNYNVGPYFNFQQGFDTYEYLEPDFVLGADDTAAKLLLVQFLRQRIETMRDALLGVRPGTAYQDAEVVNDHVFATLDAMPAGAPFFLFVGYMDPHDPYFRHPYDGAGYGRAAHPSPSLDEAGRLTELYDGEIEYWDAHFGALLAELRRRGLYETSTIVVTSDHGEELGEHGGFFHGTTLYDEQVHVPLFVRLPAGRRSGTVVHHWVQSIDLMPTLLRECGLPVPDGVRGGDLFEGSDRLFAEESHEGNVLSAVRERRGTDELKLIVANAGNPRGLPARELFRVDVDPRETRDLSRDEPETLEHAELARRAAALVAAEGAVTAGEVELDDAARRQLCELGYLSGESCAE